MLFQAYRNSRRDNNPYLRLFADFFPLAAPAMQAHAEHPTTTVYVEPQSHGVVCYHRLSDSA